MGYDVISTKLLKAVVDFISIPSSYLCSQSVMVGIFPDKRHYCKGVEKT